MLMQHIFHSRLIAVHSVSRDAPLRHAYCDGFTQCTSGAPASVSHEKLQRFTHNLT